MAMANLLQGLDNNGVQVGFEPGSSEGSNESDGSDETSCRKWD